MIKDNLFLSGTAGEVFLNNTFLEEINKINIKLTGSFEDYNQVKDYGTHHIYQGFNGEGTMEGAKISTMIDDDLIEAYQSGIMPDYSIMAKLTNPSTGKTEAYMITGVQFTEVSPVDWEAKKLVTRSMPFTFYKIKLLSSIA